VSDYERIYGPSEAALRGQPHAWIQWKGTDVCMDVHCKCGEHFHIDGFFAYSVKCPSCGHIWIPVQSIALIDPPEGIDWSQRCEPLEDHSQSDDASSGETQFGDTGDATKP
jgi:hypothetical protein